MAATGSFILESRAIIAGTEYRATSTPQITRALFSDAPSIGNCVSSILNLSLLQPDYIAKAAEVRIEMRLAMDGQVTEWLPNGTFYVSRRDTDSLTRLVTLTCYDGMLKASQKYFTGDYPLVPSAWPKRSAEVVAHIASRMGVDIDPRSSVSDVEVDAPKGYSMMQVLSFIGACSGGSWVITPAGKLRLIRLADSYDRGEIVAVLSSLKRGQDLPYTGITGSYTAGDTSGITLSVMGNPYFTQQTAAAVLSDLQGLTYVPFTATNCIYDPALELGDTVTYNNNMFTSRLYYELISLGATLRADCSAPGGGEIEDEYPYLTESEKTSQALDGITELVESNVTFTVLYGNNGDGTTTLTAKLYNGDRDITMNYPPFRYSWLKRTETGDVFLGYGYSITVTNTDYGYGGVVVGIFDTDTTVSGRLEVAQGKLVIQNSNIEVEA